MKIHILRHVTGMCDSLLGELSSFSGQSCFHSAKAPSKTTRLILRTERHMTFQRGTIFLWVCAFGMIATGGSAAAAATSSAHSVEAEAARVMGDAADDTPTEQANAAWEAKDWERSAKLYEELSHQKDAPPRVWLRLGASLRALGKNDQALAAFQKATDLGAGVFADYGRAATYAGMKDTEKAFAALASAIQQGYNDPAALSADPNLDRKSVV